MAASVKAFAKPEAAGGFRAVMALVAGAVLVAAAGSAWWLGAFGGQPVPRASAPGLERPQALGLNLNTPALASVPDATAPAAGADASNNASIEAANQQADRIKRQAAAVVAADRQRRAVERREREARERAAAERQRLAQEQAQRQAALDRQRAEEAARQQAQAAARAAAPPAPPVPVRTVDAVCAASGNFIARELCRNRECRSPAFSNDPVCVRFREVEEANRRQPTS